MGRRRWKRLQSSRQPDQLVKKKALPALCDIPTEFHPTDELRKELAHTLRWRAKQLEYEKIKMKRLQLDPMIRRKLPVLSASMPQLRKRRRRRRRNQMSSMSSSAATHNGSRLSRSTPLLLPPISNSNRKNTTTINHHHHTHHTVWRPEVSMVVTIAPPPLSKLSLRKQRRKDAKIYNAQLQMKKKEQLWSNRLKKLQRPERKSRREANHKRTQSWLKIFKLAQFCNNSTALLNLEQIKRTEEQQMKDATTLIGQSLKKSYAQKKKKQHRRSSEILKSCAWIARLNVRCRLRQKNAAMIRDFIQRATEAGRMTSAMYIM